MVERGEIWLTTLDPIVRSEIQKTRPCIIISPPEMHDYLKTVIAAPMTTGNKPAPYRIPISFADQKGLILLDQLQTLDKIRLIKKLGKINQPTLNKTLETLQKIFFI